MLRRTMALRDFERRLERLVEGVFAKAFRSRLTPVELGRRLTREMDVRRTVGIRGLIAPNQFTVSVSQTDLDNFASIENSLRGDLAGYAREHARSEGYAFLGPVEVDLQVDEKLGTGEFYVTSAMVEGTGGPSAAVILGDGSRIGVGDEPLIIGRSPDADVVLNDAQVSRHHAEIRRDGNTFSVLDLGSMNGTRVNGAGIRQQQLADGDQITVGAHSLRFEMG
ncbi:MAG: hypothetical protein AVDCRST_MAG50-1396 [uncultured Acidimicrobiales bacterium]|uniref:FHA domain-containing protein n=1 Tax=uncultured Acidimicrobiales bacterium TaxID=310071 RepID=A0A6J4HWZ2_9ACTN|nr:MAG: hypothetical protein AVDCRST_MAG50-1396 [uncultured Acidimicrobiales bacterium]